MSLYGLARLLKSRDLGPAQIGPAIEANQASALRLVPEMGEVFEQLRAATVDMPYLQEAIRLLEPSAMAIAEAVGATFGRPASARLGAKERLALERGAEHLGSELEAVRAMLGLVLAAAQAQPIDLLLANVMDGRSGHEPTFVARQAEVSVHVESDWGFVADPHVLWPLIEAAFRDVAARGDKLLFHAGTDGNGGTRLRISPAQEASRGAATPATSGSAAASPGRVAGEALGDGKLRLALGSPLEVERDVARAVARHFGIDYEIAEPAFGITLTLG